MSEEDKKLYTIGKPLHQLARRLILFAAAVRQATNGEAVSKKLESKSRNLRRMP